MSLFWKHKEYKVQIFVLKCKIKNKKLSEEWKYRYFPCLHFNDYSSNLNSNIFICEHEQTKATTEIHLLLIPEWSHIRRVHSETPSFVRQICPASPNVATALVCQSPTKPSGWILNRHYDKNNFISQRGGKHNFIFKCWWQHPHKI